MRVVRPLRGRLPVAFVTRRGQILRSLLVDGRRVAVQHLERRRKRSDGGRLVRIQRRRPAEVDRRRRRDGRERAARRRRLVVGAGAGAAAAGRLERRRGGALRRRRRRRLADVLVRGGGVPASRHADTRPMVAGRRRVARRLRVHRVRPLALLGRGAADAAAPVAERRATHPFGGVARPFAVDHLELLLGAVVVVCEITVAGHRRVQEVRRRGRCHHAGDLADAAIGAAVAVAADGTCGGYAARRTVALFAVHDDCVRDKQ